MSVKKGKQHAEDVMEECMVCTNGFDAMKRTRIACPFCKEDVNSACKECTQTYLVGSVLEPHCMQCKHQWSLVFFANSFAKAFRTGIYRKSRQDIGVDKERGMMSEAMPLVEARKQGKVLAEEEDTLKREMAALKARLQEIRERRNEHQFPGKSKEIQARVKYLFHCSVGECRGLVLQATWKCGLCEVRYCAKCHAVRGEEHECKEEDLGNAKEVMKSTRACPKCGTRIFRSHGCNQMFCTQCLTGFDWASGNIITGTIHNPHYYELQQRLGRNVNRVIGDVPCGGLLGWDAFAPHMNQLRPDIRSGLTKSLQDVHRLAGEVNDFLHNGLRQKDTMDIRVAYLENEIDDVTLKKKLFIRARNNDKKREMRNILETFRTSLVERLRDLSERLRAITGRGNKNMELRTEMVTTMLQEANKILDFCNEAMQTTLSTMEYGRMPKMVFGKRFVKEGGGTRLITHPVRVTKARKPKQVRNVEESEEDE